MNYQSFINFSWTLSRDARRHDPWRHAKPFERVRLARVTASSRSAEWAKAPRIRKVPTIRECVTCGTRDIASRRDRDATADEKCILTFCKRECSLEPSQTREAWKISLGCNETTHSFTVNNLCRNDELHCSEVRSTQFIWAIQASLSPPQSSFAPRD